ncbi:hypothetical protein [Lysinibacillus sp. G4S2]|uniref:hypothetical protein n=1 Tax=Lysinibacillus sp. G4S2 TaxID=3055859 RepID=UPI0025A1F2C3|nr:hypothetical protein [Lysinibacillus sp. G4S2]MDM5250890.1 hypothetical protein [Lysinibacillus sp. G4S2]
MFYLHSADVFVAKAKHQLQIFSVAKATNVFCAKAKRQLQLRQGEIEEVNCNKIFLIW